MSILNCEALVRRWLPGGDVIGDEYSILNPTRDDRHRGNFKINVVSGKWNDFAEDNKQGGESPITLYKYLYGCEYREAVEAVGRELGMIDDRGGIKPDFSRLLASVKGGNGKDAAYDENECMMPVPEGASEPPKQRHETERWPYWNRDGKLLGYVLRFDPPGKKKWYSPMTFWRNGGWELKHWPSPKPLYGLDLLAARPDDPVLVVEGEKTAEAARKHFGQRYVCIAWPGGSSAPDKAFWEPLHGRDTLLLPDNDDAGFKAMRAVSEKLKGALAKTVVLVDDLPEGTPVKWDVADVEALDLAWLDGLKKSTLREPVKERVRVEPKKREIPVQRFEPWPAPMLAQLERALSDRVDFPHPLASHYAALAVASHLCARRYIGPAMEPCSLYVCLIMPGPQIASSYKSAIIELVAEAQKKPDIENSLHSVNAGRMQSKSHAHELLQTCPAILNVIGNFDSVIRQAEKQPSSSYRQGIDAMLELYCGKNTKLSVTSGRNTKSIIAYSPTVNTVAFSVERRFLETLAHMEDGDAIQPVWIDENRMGMGKWEACEPIAPEIIAHAKRMLTRTLNNSVSVPPETVQCTATFDFNALIGKAGSDALKMTGSPAKARAAVVAMRRLAVVLAAWSDPEAPHIDDRLAQWVIDHELDRIRVEHETMKGKGGDGHPGIYEKVLHGIQKAGERGVYFSQISKHSTRRWNDLSASDQDDMLKRMEEDGKICCSAGKNGGMIYFPVEPTD